MTNFTAYSFPSNPSAGATTRRKMGDYLVDTIDVKDYGPLGDGSGAPLSSRYATLAAAQVDYPGVASLSETIDWAAIMMAFSWNSIFVKAASRSYSGATRLKALSWASNIVTAVTYDAHGLTAGNQIYHIVTSQTDGVNWTGQFTVASVIDAVTFTYPLIGLPGPATEPMGFIRPQVTSATWASNVVTVNYGAPHRLASGVVCDILAANGFSKNTVMTVSAVTSGTGGVVRLTVGDTASTQSGENVTVAGVGGSGAGNADGTWAATVVNGTQLEIGVTFTSGYTNGTVTNNTPVNAVLTITVTSTTQLTFPLTGHGTLAVHPFAWISGEAKLVVVSWPGIPASFPSASVFSYHMDEAFPVTPAGNTIIRFIDVTGTTLTFNEHFFNDIYAGDTVRLTTVDFGIIHISAGIYDIGQNHIQFPNNGPRGVITGPGIIRGSRPGYLLISSSRGGGPIELRDLTFINTNVAGSGMRMLVNSCFISGCKFTAGLVGLWLANIDTRNDVPFSIEVTGCQFYGTPGSANSCGIGDASNNSAIVCNYFKGLHTGVRSQNFFHAYDGNKFVNCDIGMDMGEHPDGSHGTAVSAVVLRGNAFENCGIGLYCNNLGSVRIGGTHIEGGAAATIGYRSDGLGAAVTSGMSVTGGFSTAAITVTTNELHNRFVSYNAVGAANSGAGTTWILPATQGSATIANCNASVILTYAGLISRNVASASYNSGTGAVTLTTNAAHNLTTDYPDNPAAILVTNVKVGGSIDNSYNGLFHVTAVPTLTTLTYQANFAPGTADANTGAVALVQLKPAKFMFFKTCVWSAGTVSVETWGPHGIMDYGKTLVQAVISGNYSNGFSGTFPVRVSDPVHFTYAVASNPGTVDPASLMTTLPSYIFGNPIVSHCETLPSISNVWPHSYEGMSRASISDGRKLGGGTANIGDIVEGGGTQHISVVWTSNGWMRRG